MQLFQPFRVGAVNSWFAFPSLSLVRLATVLLQLPF
jgi:hypothetical protein